MKAAAREILSLFQTLGLISEMRGAPETLITRIAAVEDARPGDLVFVDKKDYVELVRSQRPSAVVTNPKLKDFFTGIPDLVVFVSPNVPLAHAQIKQKLADRDFGASGWTGVHPSAIIHESTKIDAMVVIEPHAVVGKNVVIGKNSRIMAGAVLEHDVVIGENSVIHPLVVVGYGCRIGSHVVIESGTVIGSQGYGFAQDEKRKSHPIPQTGIVVIEDRVRVGSNCSIDRAAYRVTKIGAGTKIDNLCHIAHNVQIGEDCLLTSMLCIAGSSKIGDRVITSGQTGVLDHVEVGSDVVLLHRAGVSKDLSKPGAYAGYPLLPLNQYMRNTAVLKSGEELQKRVRALEKKLGIDSSEGEVISS